ncbi:MAG: hypothetical protein U0R19_00380 [Bryobacteraceae bacterium]
MLSGACDGAPNQNTAWSAGGIGGTALVQFLTCTNVLAPGGYPQIFISAIADAPLDMLDGDVSSWSIAPAVPEPSTAMLWLTGLTPAVIAYSRRRWGIRRR